MDTDNDEGGASAIMHDRRRFLQGSLACACSACLSSTARGQSIEVARIYCGVQGATDIDPKQLIPLQQYSKRAVVDYIERERELLRMFFNTNPDIYFDPKDRYARMNGARRYIAVGEGFVTPSMRLQSLSGLLAHEDGHIFQVGWNLDLKLSDVRGYRMNFVELHADYLAGAYMGWRQIYRHVDAAELAAFFFSLGDTSVASISHHGTSQERFRAFQQGYHDFSETISVSRATRDVEW